MKKFQQMRFIPYFQLLQLFVLSLLAPALLSLSSCSNEQIDLAPLETIECDTTNITYADDIQPLIQVNCLNRKCHNSSLPNVGHPADALWDQFSNLQRYALEENLLAKIEGTHTSGQRMPLGYPPLSPCEIEAVRAWINQGAPRN